MMEHMLPSHALRDGFSLWLEDIVGSNRIKYGAASGGPWLDPFATSCRNTARFAPWLAQVAKGQQISASDPAQAVSDMGAIGVVTGYPTPSTTPMGERVLERWSELSLVASKDDIAEIARCAILYREGLRADDEAIRKRYDGYMRSYRRLVRLRPHAYWTQDLHHLYMPMFLDQEDERGYNPFEVLIVLCGGDIGPLDQWQAWATTGWDGHERLARLLQKVASFRPGGTRSFVRALETCLVADTRPKDFPHLLTAWGYPNA